MSTLKRWFAFGALGIALLVPLHATSTFYFDTVRTGATPGGPPPWAQMSLVDVAGGVQVTFTHLLTDPGESSRYVRRLHFRFSSIPTGFNSLGDPFVSDFFIGNHYVADADLSFNAYVEFNLSPPRLTQGNSSTFVFLGVSKGDFNFLEPTSAMAHLFGLRGSENSKIIAPEPASMLALSAGLFGLYGFRRRKR